MPDADPVSNAPHLAPRRAVPAGSHDPVIGQHEHSAALELEELISNGDAGGARALVHELANGLHPFKPSPWALLTHLSERAIARQQEPVPVAAAPLPPAAAVPAASISET